MVHPWMEGTITVGDEPLGTLPDESSQAQDDAAERIAAAEAAAAAAEAASQQAISELSVNEKIEITMDFTNDSNVQQSFAPVSYTHLTLPTNREV